MDEATRLAQIYVERHPVEAAQVLEEQDASPEDVGELILSLPEPVAARLLAALPVSQASPGLAALGDEDCARYLRHLPARETANVLRPIPPDRRAALLRLLPAAMRIQVELILRQPMHRVGAWMSTGHLAVPHVNTVEAVRRRLRRMDRPVAEIFVVDDEERLIGIVQPARLFSANGSDNVASVAETPPAMLRAGTSIDNAIDHPAWHEADVMPVVDGRGRLVGSIRNAALRDAARQRSRREAGLGEADYWSLTNNVYVGLAEVLTTSMARAPTLGAAAGEEGAKKP